jgi:hypothetical protein
MAPSSPAQWAGSVATFLAVLVALFKDSIREWRRKPELEITCKNEPPWTVRTPLFVNAAGQLLWTGESYWVRVKVENKGRTRAEKVQVSLSKLCYSPGLDGSFAEDSTRQHFPLNLKWSHYGVPFLDGISPDMAALCDVIALSDPANPYRQIPPNMPSNNTVGSLQLEVDLPPEFHSLRPGYWKLTLRIAAANAKPIDKTLLFSHTGEWRQHDDDMRRECLRVSLT